MTSSRRLSIVLAGLIAGFVVLSFFELSEALQLGSFKAALFVDGLHNALEIVLLGLNLRECLRKVQGIDESSVPKLTVTLTLLVAIPSAGYALANPHPVHHAGAPALLAMLSLILNIIGGVLVHSCGVSHDHNAESVLVHLASDVATAGAAMIAYGLIALGLPSQTDPFATILGAGLVTIISLWYLRRHAHGHAHMRPSS